MCGIVGYIGTKKACPILLAGLTRLEYRGYDSAGISTIEKDGLSIMKDKGRVKNLSNLGGIDKLEEKIANIDKEMEANPSNYGLLNELTNEKEALEEELLYKYERVEYLEDLAKKIEEYKKK